MSPEDDKMQAKRDKKIEYAKLNDFVQNKINFYQKEVMRSFFKIKLQI